VQSLAGDRVIVRCAWLYSTFPGNALTRLLGQMRRQVPLRIVADQIGVPTAAREVAAAIWWCGSNRTCDPIAHWASSGEATRYELAVAIEASARKYGILSAPTSLTPVTSDEYAAPARRPRYSALDASRTWRAMAWTPPHWRLTVDATVHSIAQTPSKEIRPRRCPG
jgi:dTDP-4-dehydrorhamnose reductase